MSSAASAFLRASRLAQARGSSPRFGVSSISAGTQRVGLDAGLVEQARAGAASRKRERISAADHGTCSDGAARPTAALGGCGNTALHLKR